MAELDEAGQFTSPGRLERFVEGSLRMRVEAVEFQGDLVSVGVAPCQQVSGLARPVHFRPTLAGGRLPPAKGSKNMKTAAVPGPLVIDAPGTALHRRDRRTGFLDQLHGLLVHSYRRASRVNGTPVSF